MTAPPSVRWGAPPGAPRHHDRARVVEVHQGVVTNGLVPPGNPAPVDPHRVGDQLLVLTQSRGRVLRCRRDGLLHLAWAKRVGHRDAARTRLTHTSMLPDTPRRHVAARRHWPPPCATLTGMAPAWKEYQEATAAQFRALGLTADTDQRLEGVRGVHAVDVAVRGNRAGMKFLWVVECKRWKTNVPKSAVATLSSIVQDLGADRGILMSEKRFQSGAVALARGSNITLTRLAVMKEDTYREWVEYQCIELIRRWKDVREKVRSRTVFSRRGNFPTARVPGGLDTTKVYGRTGILEAVIEHGVLKDHWPLDVTVVDAHGAEARVRTNNFAEFLELAERELTSIEEEINEWLSRLPPAAP